jgi:Ser/Thr protein kinase RdoA (MazF antagonist)
MMIPSPVKTKDPNSDSKMVFGMFAGLRKDAYAPSWLMEDVCRKWNVQAGAVQLRLVSVSENATFALSVAGETKAMVRVSQPGYVAGSRAVASEMAWIRALHEVDDVHVIDPMRTVDGSFVAEIDDAEGITWTVVCTRFVPGMSLENVDDPVPDFATIGASAARFHAHARQWRPPSGFTRFQWNIADMIGPSPRWGHWEDADLEDHDRRVCNRALSKAMEVMAQVSKTKQSWGLIHADMRLSNAIRQPDGTIAVIDFDDAGYGWYLYDYAASLSFIEHRPLALRLARAWVQGYEHAAGKLNNQQLGIMAALSMIRRLQMLGWTTNHREDALPDGLAEEQPAGSVACALRYLDDSLWLLS